MRFNDLMETVLSARGEGSDAAVTRWRQCLDLLAQMPADHEAQIDSPESERLLAGLDAIRHDVPLARKVASVTELDGWIRSPLLVRFLAGDHPAVASATMSRARLTDAQWQALIPGVGPFARSILRRRAELGPLAKAALGLFGRTDLTLAHDGNGVAMAEMAESDVTDDGVVLELTSAEVCAVYPVAAELETESRVRRDADSVLPDLAARLGAVAQNDPGSPPAAPADGADGGDDSGNGKGEWPSEISQIVDRIEAFRSRQPDIPGDPVEVAPPPSAPPVLRFLFEADTCGVIRAVTGAPRAAAVGLSIGAPSLDGLSGADGQGLGAFRRRAPIVDARYVIRAGRLAGEWRMSARPNFDAATGRFQGYSGEARRALAHEMSVRPPDARATWSGLSAGTARQLVHELRTPLNAIQGFAEIIETQLFGPVSGDYREMAGKILDDTRQLIGTFDDLDLASRLERGDAELRGRRHPVIALLSRALAPYRLTPDGASAIVLETEGELPRIDVDSALAERLFMHLFRTLAALRGEDEVLTARLSARADAEMVDLSIDLPTALADWAEDDIYRESARIAREDADGPPLGSAFSLRLVRSLAATCGGAFRVTDGACLLTLPAPAWGGGLDDDDRMEA